MISMSQLTNKFIYTIIFFVLFSLSSHSQAEMLNMNSDEVWVDSVYKSLSLTERVAQLIFVRANNSGEDYFKEIPKYIRDYNIGGICFFANSPVSQAKKTNEWQKLAKTPLLISIDGEYGVGMRLYGIHKFPYQITLGAIQNDTLLYYMGKEVASQCKRLGIQMNFAPVVDININPKNPVINSRSFGEDKFNVASKSLFYMKGMQDQGIIAIAKHFPGHGDTDSDSHYTLPIVNHSKSRLDSIELFPFKHLINNGLKGIMIAHLYVPAYVSEENTASTLSKSIVTDLLKKELNFEGLIITDALDMSGVTKYFKPGIIEQKALLAGNDILLLPQDVPKAIRKLKKAIEKGIIPMSLIEEKCKKILLVKYRSGLAKIKAVELSNLVKDINNKEARSLIRELYKESLTLVKNDNNLIPLKKLDTLKIASLTIGNSKFGSFQQRLSDYAKVQHFYLISESTKEQQDKMLKKLAEFDLVITAIQNTSINPSKKFGLTFATNLFISKLSQQQEIILDLFANPYVLDFIPNHPNIKSILISYEDKAIVHDLSAQLIFGGIPAKGKLAVTVNDEFPINKGINTQKSRLEYSSAEDLGILQSDLKKVDSIALFGITKKAYPGCQIMAIKDGKVFYQKSFGKHTYKSSNLVRNTDIYDIASITKVVATSVALMRLNDQNLINLDDKLSDYVPFLKSSNKRNVLIRELLTHQARFKAWIPYYRATLTDGRLNDEIYNSKISDEFPIRVAENLYIKESYKYAIMDSILNSSLREKNDYKYSDLGFYLLARLIDNVTNKSISDYCDINFYKPLGLNRISYFPRNHFSLSEIIPTEDDKEFRGQLLHGDVHDPGAAMLGGMSGHAGLFSNANDLGVIMQMLLQEGNYGGESYLSSEVIREFTNYQYPLNENRRGLGFDKPLLEYDKDGVTCESATPSSFGHSGFTGTYVWVDPAYDFIYIFLSNRVHPDASNSLIMDLNIRTAIHEAFYQAIRNSNKLKSN